MPNGVSRDTFQGYDTDSKLDTLFDYIHEIHENQCKQIDKCISRFEKIEKRKNIDKGFAGAMGIIGGFVASLFKFGG